MKRWEENWSVTALKEALGDIGTVGFSASTSHFPHWTTITRVRHGNRSGRLLKRRRSFRNFWQVLVVSDVWQQKERPSKMDENWSRRLHKIPKVILMVLLEFLASPACVLHVTTISSMLHGTLWRQFLLSNRWEEYWLTREADKGGE